MLMLVKTPLTCVIFMLYTMGFYYRKPHIPIRSTKIFQRLIAVALLNSSFDLITVCTVNNRDVIPEFVNLIAHIIYLMSILGFIYLLFLYMRSYLETSLKFSGTVRFLHNLPFAVSAVGILVLPITYVHGEATDYSLGPKAYALYGSLAVYLILILYYCLRYWKLLDSEKRMAILLAVPLFVITAVIQVVLPETLLVVVCSTLILLGLILSNENTEKYVDRETALFNQYSLEKVLNEFDFEKQHLIAAILCFARTENSSDWELDARILDDVYRELRQYRLYGYRVCENGVAFICGTRTKASLVLKEIKSIIEAKYGREAFSVETNILVEEAADAKSGCIRSIITFCTEAGSRFAYIDHLTNVYNRNALERDLNERQGNGAEYYLIADLNNLKTVNDTLGHSAGDALLQGFAQLLADAVGANGRVYRQGGDEFAVLYDGDAQRLIKNLDERCEAYNQSCDVPLSYAIGCCRTAEEGFRDVADQMMYEDKRRKKAAKALKSGSL